MTTPNTWPQKKKLELTAIMCAPPPHIEITVCFSHAQEDLFFSPRFSRIERDLYLFLRFDVFNRRKLFVALLCYSHGTGR